MHPSRGRRSDRMSPPFMDTLTQFVIGAAADPFLAIEQHRSFTHALLFTPVGAALAAAPRLLHREWRARAGPVYAAASSSRGCTGDT